MNFETEFVELKNLTDDEKVKLEKQNSRLVSDFQAKKLENEARRNWDLFYKRNETRFFKDRHWISKEFEILTKEKLNIFEVGCGVGNFFYPLLEENPNLFIYACDFSIRAVKLVEEDARYNTLKMKIFQADITQDNLITNVPENTIDISTLIFVLSAIHPDKFIMALINIYKTLKPGGKLLFRDYARYDMAQFRFKPGNKIAENFYMRQDGTRSYYFTVEELGDLAKRAGYEILNIGYIQRRTVNVKEDVNIQRHFIQAQLLKPS